MWTWYDWILVSKPLGSFLSHTVKIQELCGKAYSHNLWIEHTGIFFLRNRIIQRYLCLPQSGKRWPKALKQPAALAPGYRNFCTRDKRNQIWSPSLLCCGLLMTPSNCTRGGLLSTIEYACPIARTSVTSQYHSTWFRHYRYRNNSDETIYLH